MMRFADGVRPARSGGTRLIVKTGSNPWQACPGAGPFHQLPVPEQVTAMIERFLATAL
jgi:hypothetical protein